MWVVSEEGGIATTGVSPLSSSFILVVLIFEEAIITSDPELEVFPPLFQPVVLTCGAVGIPDPNITWYKDGVLLEGEKRTTLVISEVQISDRGVYHCDAGNIDPNNGKPFNDRSDNVVVNIKGEF